LQVGTTEKEPIIPNILLGWFDQSLGNPETMDVQVK
jgi:hypothetical protein